MHCSRVLIFISCNSQLRHISQHHASILFAKSICCDTSEYSNGSNNETLFGTFGIPFWAQYKSCHIFCRQTFSLMFCIPSFDTLAWILAVFEVLSTTKLWLPGILFSAFSVICIFYLIIWGVEWRAWSFFIWPRRGAAVQINERQQQFSLI